MHVAHIRVGCRKVGGTPNDYVVARNERRCQVSGERKCGGHVSQDNRAGPCDGREVTRGGRVPVDRGRRLITKCNRERSTGGDAPNGLHFIGYVLVPG